MMGTKSTHINDNNKLGGTNYGLWKFWLKTILIRKNAYHYVVLDPNRNVMENPFTIAQGQQKVMTIISLSIKNEIIPYI
jgi:hypothetical protein